ncbi:MAG: N-acetylmuramoyl-L-alanine amidase [Bacteroidota bacterium]
MKRLLVIFIVTVLSFCSYAGTPKKSGKLNKVVIDAGHGGKDPGALGSKTKEKDIVLSIALKLGKCIEENFSDVTVIYTRKTDEFIELYNRAKIANTNKADLFISIHCNATKSPEANGVETFVMGINKSTANLDVAKKENAAILKEDNYLQKYDGFNPNSAEAEIIFSLYQNAFLDQSLDFASKVQNQLRDKLKRFDRGVKQAGFLVLYKTTMPGVLIETGFISNTKEEAFLNSEAGQLQIANSIYKAFKEYKYQTEGFNNQHESSTESHKDSISNVTETTNINTDTIKYTGNLNIVFKVQFATSPKEKSVHSAEFKHLKGVSMYHQNGLYKYMVGEEINIDKAVDLQKKMIASGYKDAFVVAFMNNERISPTQAMQLINKSKP